MQGESHYGKGDCVVGGISEELQSIRPQAHRPGDDAGGKLDTEQRQVDRERNLPNPPVAVVSLCSNSCLEIKTGARFFPPGPLCGFRV